MCALSWWVLADVVAEGALVSSRGHTSEKLLWSSLHPGNPACGLRIAGFALGRFAGECP